MEKQDILIGKCKERDIYVDLHANANKHILVTGSSGTGKTNFLKVLTSQNKELQTYIMDYSDSFSMYGNAVLINVLETAEIQEFFEGLNEDNIGMIADAIQGAWRMGQAQKAAVVTALCIMMKPIKDVSVMTCEDSLFKPYLRYENGFVRKGWALFAFILNNACGVKGQQIAMRMIDIVCKLSKYKVVNTEESLSDHSTVIVKFPIESCGLNAQLVELYLWKLWLRQIKDRHSMMIVLDECQDLWWKKGSIAERLLSEGRKFGIGQVLSTQFLNSNFPKRVINSFMQSGLRVIFAPPESEIKEIAQSLDSSSWKNWLKSLRNLRVGTCIVSGMVRFGQRTNKQKLIVQVSEYKEKGNKIQEEEKMLL